MSKLLFKLEHANSLLEAEVEGLRKQNETLKQQKSFLFEENSKASEEYDLLYAKYQELERKLAISAEVDTFLSSAKELAPEPEPAIKESSDLELNRKRKDLRDAINSSKRAKNFCYKTLLCHHINCKNGDSCTFAHSIQELNICLNGRSCPNRECAAMIHSNSERDKLDKMVRRKGLFERACNNSIKCPNSYCKFIHWSCRDGLID